MGSGNALLAPFDIIAVRPTTEKALQIACSTLDVDIISLNLSSRLPFYLKHTLINQAISRGICFEITYAPAIRNAASRRQLISNATSLVRVTRGRHIIVASDAATALELRGPYDIINFCSLFGMNQSAARDCLTHNARQVLYHAATRRAVHKGTVALADDIASALDEKPSISIDTDAIMNDNDDDDDDTMDVKE
ncbi:RNase P subunit p30-domain-containing protein [Syncephalis plumigaleata]|nr:RNase P subunit p30-domain-containing protein [Syncephalis plumigaleata]